MRKYNSKKWQTHLLRNFNLMRHNVKSKFVNFKKEKKNMLSLRSSYLSPISDVGEFGGSSI